MKICVLVSSYDGTGPSTIFQDVGDTYQDPSLYVNSHSFTLKILTKADALETIKATVQEGYDYIWNFLWGSNDSEYYENVAGVEAVKYLESTGHPMLGTSSRYLSLTKLDLKKTAAVSKGAFQVPNWILMGSRGDYDVSAAGLVFPLIVKPANSIGSLDMTKNSVVHTKQELEQQIGLLQSKIGADKEILVEEFIPGLEVSVMILETRKGTIALHPISYTFPEDLKETEKFLDFETKFIGVENDIVTFKLWDGDSELMKKIQESGIAAYESLGVLGSGYARVDLRVNGNQVYVLEVNHTPAFFSALGNKYGDDFVIQETFPGGHTALVEEIIGSKQRIEFIPKFYNKFAPSYDQYVLGPLVQEVDVWKEIVQENDFQGKVLDLGCGTGLLGNLIRKKYATSTELVGIDLSPQMTERATAYNKIHLGRIENVLMSNELGDNFDHIIALGVLLYLEHKHFNLILGRCFDLAKKSVTLTIEKVESTYANKFETVNTNSALFDHFEAMKEFQPPIGWSLVKKREDALWISPTTQEHVSGMTVRFEKSLNHQNNNVEME